ncbi:UDP-N-acetylmuramate dehydrogenase [Siminovitchia sp. FSL H7-0308]|uniref:UDP-N-acetylenolpyruvoylglucosamine reductase n=1 Tax=Siminovitchia thermophila TaxID=1245522 RepID=A0ABS2R7H8_9BACI|nr:UDP-N-acetylmuramate dehydrogenase [Siminovitchia thermophila]MBM7715583.1 UDP-N-acetylmuramate dehydrogenase [Siminovitchia thermophila]ONK23320.1 UDP-N-acetylenolpyruvoylglucosamine reductase [Bacillus sp. VT-16-64]
MDFLEELHANQVGKIKEYEPLANHTTIKVGGPADIFVEPDSIDLLLKTMEIVQKHHMPWRVIGRGSNLLVSDEGIEGVVIKLGKGLDHLEVNGTEVRVGAGYSFIVLANAMARRGLSGLEFAGGIPGSVGGAVYMNAGAHGSDVSKILRKAHILFPDGTVEWLSNEEMEYSYRTSVLQKKRPGIVLEAVFELREGDRELITVEMKKHKHYRRETQPVKPCCGSVFRNPLPHHAGKLIQDANLKGFQIGGAQISELHGNFIINTGNAKAEDVIKLIDHIKKTIFESTGIHLHTEVEIVQREID